MTLKASRSYSSSGGEVTRAGRAYARWTALFVTKSYLSISLWIPSTLAGASGWEAHIPTDDELRRFRREQNYFPIPQKTS